MLLFAYRYIPYIYMYIYGIYIIIYIYDDVIVLFKFKTLFQVKLGKNLNLAVSICKINYCQCLFVRKKLQEVMLATALLYYCLL